MGKLRDRLGRIALIVLWVAPWIADAQLARNLEPGAQWAYMHRPGETLTLTILGTRRTMETKFLVHAAGFRRFSGAPALYGRTYEFCLLLDEDAFNSNLAAYIDSSDTPLVDQCEGENHLRVFNSFERAIDSLESSVYSAPRPQPEVTNTLLENGILPSTHASPIYPAAAVVAKLEGWVLLEFKVTKDGKAADVTVVDSSPPGIFESSALTWSSLAQFEPKIVDGTAVEVPSVQNLVFYEIAK